jgi:hypothetical protein
MSTLPRRKRCVELCHETLVMIGHCEWSYPATGALLVCAVLGFELELESRCLGNGRVVY